MRASGEGKQRLLALMSVVAVLVGGTALAGQLFRSRAPREALPPNASLSPLSVKRQVRLRELQGIVKQLRDAARGENWERVVALAEKQEHRSGLVRALKAEALARLGRHDEAAAILIDLYRGQQEPTYWVIAGEFEEMEQGIRLSIARAQNEPDQPGPAVRVAWEATLSPRVMIEPQEVLRLAEQAVARSEKAPTSPLGRVYPTPPGRFLGQPDRADTLRMLGMVLLRQGRTKEALQRLNESEQLRSTPHLWPYIAICLRRLNRRDEAAQFEARLMTFLTDTFGGHARPLVYFLYLRELTDIRRAAGEPSVPPRTPNVAPPAVRPLLMGRTPT